MAARIEEYDFDTKHATIKKIRQMQREIPSRFDAAIFRWWKKVYMAALELCPVETGALRASIRIQRGKGNTKKFEVSRQPSGVQTEYYIVAGGGGVINPRHRREVDYAAAVHDGYVRSDGYVWPGNPFLERAIQRHIGTMEEEIKKYMDWQQKEWAEDQPSVPQRWNLPVRWKW